jgi:hypothetical protein
MHIYVVNRKKSKEFYFFLYLFIYLQSVHLILRIY